jgi:cytochrome c553
MIRPATIMAAALLTLAGSAQAGEDASADGGPTWPSWRTPEPDPARGAQLAQVCLACHRADTPQANPPAPRLLHQRQSYIFFALRAYRQGERASPVMAAFVSQLSEQDMRDLAVFLAGDMHDRPPPARTDLPIYGLTSTECAWCHGETGIGEFEGMPVLTGQDPDYLRTALAEYRSGARTNATMRAVAQALDPEQDAALADYYAAHEWLEHRP